MLGSNRCKHTFFFLYIRDCQLHIMYQVDESIYSLQCPNEICRCGTSLTGYKFNHFQPPVLDIHEENLSCCDRRGYKSTLRYNFKRLLLKEYGSIHGEVNLRHAGTLMYIQHPGLLMYIDPTHVEQLREARHEYLGQTNLRG